MTSKVEKSLVKNLTHKLTINLASDAIFVFCFAQLSQI